MAERILIHSCCAPCSTGPVPSLQAQGFEVCTFFFNPNIHPYSEFRNRLISMQQFVRNRGITGFFYTGYPLEKFLSMQLSRPESRCAGCYELRLTATADRARQEGIRLFSTTLLVSPYQKHDMIAEIGESVCRATGVKFLYSDWRPMWRQTRLVSREEGLYLQKYCGCVFSEKERYMDGRRSRAGRGPGGGSARAES